MIIDFEAYKASRLIKGSDNSCVKITLDTFDPYVKVNPNVDHEDGTVLFTFNPLPPDVVCFKTWGGYDVTSSGINHDLCGLDEQSAPWVTIRDSIEFSLSDKDPWAKHDFYFVFKDDVWNEKRIRFIRYGNRPSVEITLDTASPVVEIIPFITTFNGTVLFALYTDSSDINSFKTWGDYNTVDGINHDLCGLTELDAPWVDFNSSIEYSLGNISSVVMHDFYFKVRDDVWNETYIALENVVERTTLVDANDFVKSNESYFTFYIGDDSAVYEAVPQFDFISFDAFVYSEAVTDPSSARPVCIVMTDLVDSSEHLDQFLISDHKSGYTDSTFISLPRDILAGVGVDNGYVDADLLQQDYADYATSSGFVVSAGEDFIECDDAFVNSLQIEKIDTFHSNIYYEILLNESVSLDDSFEFDLLGFDLAGENESNVIGGSLTDFGLIIERRITDYKFLLLESGQYADTQLLDLSGYDTSEYYPQLSVDIMSSDDISVFVKDWVDTDLLQFDSGIVTDFEIISVISSDFVLTAGDSVISLLSTENFNFNEVLAEFERDFQDSGFGSGKSAITIPWSDLLISREDSVLSLLPWDYEEASFKVTIEEIVPHREEWIYVFDYGIGWEGISQIETRGIDWLVSFDGGFISGSLSDSGIGTDLSNSLERVFYDSIVGFSKYDLNVPGTEFVEVIEDSIPSVKGNDFVIGRDYAGELYRNYFDYSIATEKQAIIDTLTSDIAEITQDIYISIPLADGIVGRDLLTEFYKDLFDSTTGTAFSQVHLFDDDIGMTVSSWYNTFSLSEFGETSIYKPIFVMFKEFEDVSAESLLCITSYSQEFAYTKESYMLLPFSFDYIEGDEHIGIDQKLKLLVDVKASFEPHLDFPVREYLNEFSESMIDVAPLEIAHHSIWILDYSNFNMVFDGEVVKVSEDFVFGLAGVDSIESIERSVLSIVIDYRIDAIFVFTHDYDREILVADEGFICFNTIVYDPSIENRDLLYWWEPQYMKDAYYSGKNRANKYFTLNPEWGNTISPGDIDYSLYAGDDNYGQVIPFYGKPKNIYASYICDRPVSSSTTGYYLMEFDDERQLFTSYTPNFKITNLRIELDECSPRVDYQTIPWTLTYQVYIDWYHYNGDTDLYTLMQTEYYNLNPVIDTQEWDHEWRYSVLDLFPLVKEIDCNSFFSRARGSYDLSKDYFVVRLHVHYSWRVLYYDRTDRIKVTYRYYGMYSDVDSDYIKERRMFIYKDDQWFTAQDVLYYEPYIYKLYINMGCGPVPVIDRPPHDKMNKFVLDKMTKYSYLNIVAPYPGEHSVVQEAAIIGMSLDIDIHYTERWSIHYHLLFEDFGYTCIDTVVYSRTELLQRDLLYWWQDGYNVLYPVGETIPNPLLGDPIRPGDFDYPFAEGTVDYGRVIYPERSFGRPADYDPYTYSYERTYRAGGSNPSTWKYYIPLTKYTDGIKISVTGHIRALVGMANVYVVCGYLSSYDDIAIPLPYRYPYYPDYYFHSDFNYSFFVGTATATRGAINWDDQLYNYIPEDNFFQEVSGTFKGFAIPPSSSYRNEYVCLCIETHVDCIQDGNIIPHLSYGLYRESFETDFSVMVREYSEEYLRYRAVRVRKSDIGFYPTDFYADLFKFKFYANLGCGSDPDLFPIEPVDDLERWAITRARLGNADLDYLWDGDYAVQDSFGTVNIFEDITWKVTFHVYFNVREFYFWEKVHANLELDVGVDATDYATVLGTPIIEYNESIDISVTAHILPNVRIKLYDFGIIDIVPQHDLFLSDSNGFVYEQHSIDLLTTQVNYGIDSSKLLGLTTLFEVGVFDSDSHLMFPLEDELSGVDSSTILLHKISDIGVLETEYSLTELLRVYDNALFDSHNLLMIPSNDGSYFTVDESTLSLSVYDLAKVASIRKRVDFVFGDDDGLLSSDIVLGEMGSWYGGSVDYSLVTIQVGHSAIGKERIRPDKNEIYRDIGYVCFWVQVVNYPFVIDWLAGHFVNYFSTVIEAEFFRYTSCFGIPPGNWPPIKPFPGREIIPDPYPYNPYMPISSKPNPNPIWEYDPEKKTKRKHGYIVTTIDNSEFKQYTLDPVNPPEPYKWVGGTSILITKTVYDEHYVYPKLVRDTFYFALFDEEWNMVSDIYKMHFKNSRLPDGSYIKGASSGMLVFFGLEPQTTYYVRETDSRGNILKDCFISEHSGNKYTMPYLGYTAVTEEDKCIYAGDFINCVERLGSGEYDPPNPEQPVIIIGKPSPDPQPPGWPFEIEVDEPSEFGPTIWEPFIDHYIYPPPEFPSGRYDISDPDPRCIGFDCDPYCVDGHCPPPDEEEDDIIIEDVIEGKLIERFDWGYTRKQLITTIPVEMYAVIWESHYIPATFILELSGMRIEWEDGFEFEIEEPFRFDIEGFGFDFDEPFDFDLEGFEVSIDYDLFSLDEIPFEVKAYEYAFHLEDVGFEFEMLFEDFQFDWVDYDGNQADPTPQVLANVYTYDGNPHRLCMYVGSSGKTFYRVDGESEWSDVIPERVNAGTYKVFWYSMPSLQFTGYGSPTDYFEVNCIINKATPALSVASCDIIYKETKVIEFYYKGDGVVSCTVESDVCSAEITSISETVSGDTLSDEHLVLMRVKGLKCGQAEIVIHSSLGDNYLACENVITCFVMPAIMNVVADSVTHIYDGNCPQSSIIVEGPSVYEIRYSPESLDGAVDNGSEEIDFYKDVGEYIVYFSVCAENYKTVYGRFNLVIERARQLITVTPYHGMYDGENHPLIEDVSGASGTFWVSADGVNWDTSIPVQEEPGTYPVYWYCVGDDNHYDEGTRDYPNVVYALIEKMSYDLYLPDVVLDLAYSMPYSIPIETPSSGKLSLEFGVVGKVVGNIEGILLTIYPNEEGMSFVYIRQAEDKYYKENLYSFHATVIDTSIKFITEPVVVTYDGNYVKQNGITILRPDESLCTIMYSMYPIDEESDLSPTPEFYKDAGEYSIYFRITSPGRHAAYGSYELVIEKAEPEPVALSFVIDMAGDEIVYGEYLYDLSAEVQSDGAFGQIIYSDGAGEFVDTVRTHFVGGVLHIVPLAIGRFTMSIYQAEGTNYKENWIGVSVEIDESVVVKGQVVDVKTADGIPGVAVDITSEV